MIFLTVGSMMPFDRLVRAIDGLAPDLGDEGVFAQIGGGAYVPTNMAFSRMLDVSRYRTAVDGARLLIAHAGMGSVITAMESRKPIVLFPRRAELHEVNTDHQLATARWLTGRPGIHVAFEASELPAIIRQALAQGVPDTEFADAAPSAFLDRIRDVIKAG